MLWSHRATAHIVGRVDRNIGNKVYYLFPCGWFFIFALSRSGSGLEFRSDLAPPPPGNRHSNNNEKKKRGKYQIKAK